MTDEEVQRLAPVVDEFIEAVEVQDKAFIAKCLSVHAQAIAVILADYLLKVEKEIADLPETRRQFEMIAHENTCLRREVTDLRKRRRELQGWLDLKCASSKATHGK